MKTSYLAHMFTSLDVLPGEPGDVYARQESLEQYSSYDLESLLYHSLAVGDAELFKRLCLRSYRVGKTSENMQAIIIANMHTFFSIAARVFSEHGMPRTEAFFYHDQITAIMLKDPEHIDFFAIEDILFKEIERMRQIRLACKTTDSNMIAAIDYIGKNLHRPIRLDDVATHVGISRSRLSTNFKRAMNEPMFSYIRRLRIEEAKTLFKTLKMSTAQVSYTLQFASESYFCACFKKEVGMTPSEYKARLSGFYTNLPESGALSNVEPPENG